ncbi:MAG: OB-fold nucleic acid binding domain-containing protein [Candidatus Hydrothermarchaeales archaeon]
MATESKAEKRFSRGVAYKVPIMDITKGKYEPADSEGEINYLLTPFNEKISRCRIMATVVSRHVGEEQRFAFLTLDDTTDTISARVFKEDVELVKDIKPGDIVDIIGKIREYQEEKYINIESITRMDDPNWELVRKLEILWHEKESGIRRGKDEIVAEEEFEAPVEEEVVSEDSKALILGLIDKLDEGEGVRYLILADESGLDDEKLEETLNELLGEGEIYEPKIGRFRKV